MYQHFLLAVRAKLSPVTYSLISLPFNNIFEAYRGPKFPTIHFICYVLLILLGTKYYSVYHLLEHPQ